METLREYLTSQDWPESVRITQLGDEYYLTLQAKDWTAIKTAARALRDSLTAYGDYEARVYSVMKEATTGDIVSITLEAVPN